MKYCKRPCAECDDLRAHARAARRRLAFSVALWLSGLAVGFALTSCFERCESHADCPSGLVCKDVTGEQRCLP